LQGLVIFWCYGLSPDTALKESNTWRYFSYTMNFNGQRPEENFCIEIGNKGYSNSGRKKSSSLAIRHYRVISKVARWYSNQKIKIWVNFGGP
jgi:hypothetical protein